MRKRIQNHGKLLLCVCVCVCVCVSVCVCVPCPRLFQKIFYVNVILCRMKNLYLLFEFEKKKNNIVSFLKRKEKVYIKAQHPN